MKNARHIIVLQQVLGYYKILGNKKANKFAKDVMNK